MANVHDVAAELRQRLHPLGTLKLHKLLYYCQGHHLATFGEPLFRETVSAWDKGPVIGTLWHAEVNGGTTPPAAALDEAALNTIGYVVHRYGTLSGNDLINMTHNERPWQLADATRPPGGSTTIQRQWMLDYFRTEGAPGAGDDELPIDSTLLSRLAAEATQHPGSGREDTREDILAWVNNAA